MSIECLRNRRHSHCFTTSLNLSCFICQVVFLVRSSLINFVWAALSPSISWLSIIISFFHRWESEVIDDNCLQCTFILTCQDFFSYLNLVSEHLHWSQKHCRYLITFYVIFNASSMTDVVFDVSSVAKIFSEFFPGLHLTWLNRSHYYNFIIFVNYESYISCFEDYESYLSCIKHYGCHVSRVIEIIIESFSVNMSRDCDQSWFMGL